MKPPENDNLAVTLALVVSSALMIISALVIWNAIHNPRLTGYMDSISSMHHAISADQYVCGRDIVLFRQARSAINHADDMLPTLNPLSSREFLEADFLQAQDEARSYVAQCLQNSLRDSRNET